MSHCTHLQESCHTFVDAEMYLGVYFIRNVTRRQIYTCVYKCIRATSFVMAHVYKCTRVYTNVHVCIQMYTCYFIYIRNVTRMQMSHWCILASPLFMNEFYHFYE